MSGNICRKINSQLKITFKALHPVEKILRVGSAPLSCGVEEGQAVCLEGRTVVKGDLIDTKLFFFFFPIFFLFGMF